MANLNKFLTLINGVRTIASAISTSIGTPNANRIISTGSDGKLDISLMPSGFQQSSGTTTTESMIASEALSAGDFVNIWNNSGVRNTRRANAFSGKPAHGFVLNSVTSGASATVNLKGENTGITASLIPGNPVFLSDVIPGGVTAIAPATSGHISQQLGYAISPNSVMFDYAGYVQILTTPTPSLAYRGVNLAGAEFADNNLPGTYNNDYSYPPHSDIDYFLSKGMNTIRLPFRWERLQEQQLAIFDPSELARIDDFVSYATSNGAKVILDPHNYARYFGGIIGQDVPASSFADFWSKLATYFKSNSLVIFGLMNEPNTMPTETWLADANAAIQAIRNTGAKNLILVPGNAYSGAWDWTQNWYGTANSVAMLGIVDPVNNYAFEVHQYLDSDYSGTHTECQSTTIGSQSLASFTAWLRQNNKQGFLGEFSGSANSTCAAAVNDMLNYLEANADVWLGWTYWAAGARWGSYLSLEPNSDGTDSPQMPPLLPHLFN